MSEKSFEEKKKELIKKIEGLNEKKLKPESLDNLTNTLLGMVTRAEAGNVIAWNQSYTESPTHSETHNEQTDDPNHNEHWSQAIT